jgi:L-alanine-DL-glutamate epimerase-like enolase superfamily enzyme
MAMKRKVAASTERWAFRTPFKITGYIFSDADLLHVTVTENGASGHGEASGVYFLNETGASMLAQIGSVKNALESGVDREELRELLPAGGARNAVDCALWDLEAKLKRKSIWELTNLQPGVTQSVYTIGLDTPEEMVKQALLLDNTNIKVKLNNELPLERISGVRAARPDAEIIVDVNQGWTFEQLVELAPKFKELEIAMIEQPLPRGGDEALATYDSPIVLCADESCLDTTEFEQASHRYQMINIKLDKTGGLTEALDLAAMAKARGIELMVGNMMGTSLAMAPGYVVAQLCRFVDLDGALFLTRDREHPMTFEHGMLTRPSPELWG